MRRSALPLLFLPLVALPGSAAGPTEPAPAATALQDDDDLDEILAARALEAEELDMDGVWRSAREVSSLLGDEVGAPFDVAVLFAKARADLQRDLPTEKAGMSQAGALWIAWPKRASRALGIVDVVQSYLATPNQ